MQTLYLENNIIEGDHPELEHVEMLSAQPPVLLRKENRPAIFQHDRRCNKQLDRHEENWHDA